MSLNILATYSSVGWPRGVTIVDNEMWISRFALAASGVTSEVGTWDPLLGFSHRFSLPFRVGGIAYDSVEQVLWVGAYGGYNGANVLPYRLDGTPINSGFQADFPIGDYYITGLELGP